MLKTFRSGFAFLALIAAIGVLFPQARTWGVHFLAYYPIGMQALFALAAACLAVVSLFPSLTEKLAEHFAVARPRPLLTDVVVAVLCGAGFYLFSSAVPLLGDGQLRIDELTSKDNAAWIQHGPLTVLAHDRIYHLLQILFAADVTTVFRLTSALSGIAAVFTWLRYSRAIGLGLTTALFWGFAWGGVAMFFGYVELYLIMIGILSAALMLMMTSLRKERFNVWVPLLAVLAVGFNYVALTFLPAVGAYVWWGVSHKPLKPKIVFQSVAALFLIAGIGYFLFGWHRGTAILLPLWPSAASAGGYAFAPKHFIDLANGLFLNAGLFIVLAVAVLTTRREQPFWNTERLLLALALIVPFAAYFMHHSGLGMARDWDIGATLLLAVPFASLSLWKDGFTSARTRLSGLLLAAAWIFVVIIPWIGVQASETRAMTRFRNLLQLDPERSANGWDYLGAFYRLRGETDEWGRCYEEALKHSDNPRYHYNLAVYYVSKRQWDQSLAHVHAVRDAVYADSAVTGWEARVLDPQSVIEIGFEYEKRSRYDDARQTYWLASQLDPHSPLPPTALSQMVVRMRDLNRAEGMLRVLLNSFPQHVPEVKRYYGTLTKEQATDRQIEGLCGMSLLTKIDGDISHAHEYLKRAQMLAPADSQITAYFSSLER